ncbi:MAG: type II secretion system protein [Candidatus Riflebacteria bacterium]|nr:type II secretion system protein [Candidatus Riflebacteria bacterium]
MRHGMTILELLLVVGIVGIMAASGAPFVARSMGWVYEVQNSDHEFSRLYDASMILSRYIGQSGTDNVKYESKTIKIDGNTVIDNVEDWKCELIADTSDKAYKCELKTQSSLVGEQFLRFVVFSP